MIARIDEARSAGDTVGGVFEVVVHGLPVGLGSYVHWDRRLDAALAAAVMSINIVKGVEFGLGFEQTRRFGSARPRRHRGPRRRGPLGPPDQQRRRPDRWRHERRTARRPRCRQADLHARPAAPVRGPRHRRGRGQGPLRTQRHQRRAGGGRRRGGDGAADPGRRSSSRSSVATRWPTSRPTWRRIARRLAAPIPAPVPGHPHGLTGTDEAGSGGDD